MKFFEHFEVKNEMQRKPPEGTNKGKCQDSTASIIPSSRLEKHFHPSQMFLLHLLHSPATKKSRHMEEKMPGAGRDTYTTAICR